MIRSLIFAFAFLFTQGLFAQPYLKDSTAVAEHGDKFMDLLSKKAFKDAFNALDEYSRLSKNEIGRLSSKMRKQITGFSKDFGKILGKSFIQEERIRDLLIHRTYLLRYEDHPVRFHLVYYRSSKGWIFDHIRWNKGVFELFKD